MALVDEILRLKREKKAILLAHNYQRPEIQDIADYVGDSIELSRKAMDETEAEIIVFSAVDFMAESAAILNPDKRVLIPNIRARCPMAQMLLAEDVRSWKKRYPKAPVALYVNTLAEAKAECDVCYTSANAVKVVNALEADTVLLGPDHNLAWYVAQRTSKKIVPVPEKGFCRTHMFIIKEDVLFSKEEHPDAVAVVHPECVPEVQLVADFIGSTSQMCRYARESPTKKIIVGTEIGIIHRLRKENPDKEFIPACEGAICPNMKFNTLENIYLSLKEEQHLVTVPEATARRAREALERMFLLTR